HVARGFLNESTRARGAFVIEPERPHFRGLVQAARLHRLSANIEDRSSVRKQKCCPPRACSQIRYRYVAEWNHVAAKAGCDYVVDVGVVQAGLGKRQVEQ